eukprot:821532-Prymnesium_polylepis.2
MYRRSRDATRLSRGRRHTRPRAVCRVTGFNTVRVAILFIMKRCAIRAGVGAAPRRSPPLRA